MQMTGRVVCCVMPLTVLALAGSRAPALAQAVPNPCSLLTKAEMQKLTGNANAMGFPNEPGTMGAFLTCAVDGGGTRDLSFEFMLTTRSVRTPLKGAEQLTGIGDSATFAQTKGNARVSVAKGGYMLTVGAQSSDTPQALKDVTIAVAKAAAAKLP